MVTTRTASCTGASLLIFAFIGILLFEAITTTEAAPRPSYSSGYYSPLSLENPNPEYLLQTIARLRQALINDDDLENTQAKRALRDDYFLDEFNYPTYYDNHEKQTKRKTEVDFGVNRGHSGEKEHSTKRGLDLGLGRGFSGSQAAKHLMGLAAANFAGGPGRKRRSDTDDLDA